MRYNNINLQNHVDTSDWFGRWFSGRLFLFFLAIGLTLPLIGLTDIPLRDVLTRYAPMAQAMIDHNWVEAFHARIPFLTPLLGAFCSVIFHCDVFLGLKIASMLCFASTVFPLWEIFQRVFNESVARLGCLLFVFCSYWLRIASGGIRESGKLLWFSIAVLGVIRVFQERRSLKGYLLAGIGCGAMPLIRDDSLLVSAAIGLTLLGLEIIGTKHFPWRSFAAGALGVLILLPAIGINYAMTGYPVVSNRFVGMASKVMKSDIFGPTSLPLARLQPGNSKIPRGSLFRSASTATLPASSKWSAKTAFFEPVTWKVFIDFFDSTAKGLYFFFALPAVIMIVLRIYRREWKREETLLVMIWGGHTLLIIFQIAIFDRYLYVSRRYLLPAAPLAFGWTALAILELYRYGLRHFSARLVRVSVMIICVVLGILLYLDALMPQLKQRFTPKHADGRDTLLTWSRKIRLEYRGPSHQENREFLLDSYFSFRRPLILCDVLPELGYMAGGEGVAISPEKALVLGLRGDYCIIRFDGKAPEYPGWHLLDTRIGRKYSYALYSSAVGVK